MVRSAPSRADEELITQLAARGITASATQLHTWRRVGLLPKPRVVRLGARGSAAVHPNGMLERAAAVASHVRRGRAFAVTAVALFADGVDVPAALLLRGVRCVADRFATEFEQAQRKALQPGGNEVSDADTLSVAERMAAKLIAGNGSMVRSWRANLRAHPPPGTNAANREAVLLGAVTSMMRLFMSDLPEADDSLAELAAAAGVDGVFKTAPFADDAAAPEGPRALRGVFTGFSTADLAECASSVTAEQLHHAKALLVPIWKMLSTLPPQLAYFLGGSRSAPPLNGDDPETFAMLILSFVLISRDGFDVNVDAMQQLLELAGQLGVASSEEIEQAVRSASWLGSLSSATQ